MQEVLERLAGCNKNPYGVDSQRNGTWQLAWRASVVLWLSLRAAAELKAIMCAVNAVSTGVSRREISGKVIVN